MLKLTLRKAYKPSKEAPRKGPQKFLLLSILTYVARALQIPSAPMSIRHDLSVSGGGGVHIGFGQLTLDALTTSTWFEFWVYIICR